MKIVLLEDINNLGNASEIVTVKDGYARNFLIPSGKALAATKGNMKVMESIRKSIESKSLRELKTHKAMTIRLSKVELIAKVQTGEEDRMFGAVTSTDIGQMLSEKGIEIDRRIIELPEPIKALGIYNVPIRLHADVIATVKIRVEKDEKND